MPPPRSPPSVSILAGSPLLQEEVGGRCVGSSHRLCRGQGAQRALAVEPKTSPGLKRAEMSTGGGRQAELGVGGALLPPPQEPQGMGPTGGGSWERSLICQKLAQGLGLGTCLYSHGNLLGQPPPPQLPSALRGELG